MPCPTYPEISLALLPKRKIARLVDAFRPTAIHVATEGPLGMAGRSLCRRRGLPFTTSFHTRFPEYIHERARIPTAWTYRAMRWFHGSAERVMVATETVQNELAERGFDNTVRWSRGVDTELFHPRPDELPILQLGRPIHMYVGRVAIEKNIEAFLRLEVDGSKVVVGDGPQRQELERKYPDVLFTGAKHGEDLARHYAAADVFVFPSRTDTFGLVMLEALACGVPVAAYPVPGPLDVIGGSGVGVLDEDLAVACAKARVIDRQACRDYALGYSWRECAHLFESHLSPFAA
jgi:glycosyltransferase involved in cell wall biosynthesis